MPIRGVQADHDTIPLPVALSDSTHGTIRGFELVTARVRDADGVEGVGYTDTVGTGGAAVHALVARDLAPWLVGRDAERIEALWQAMWWRLHYGGRGGPPGTRVPADGRRQHAVERGRGDPRRPGAGPTTCPATRAASARAGCCR